MTESQLSLSTYSSRAEASTTYSYNLKSIYTLLLNKLAVLTPTMRQLVETQV